jgi:NTP pyrophosphatase (non-canonical NTP hydrolase)
MNFNEYQIEARKTAIFPTKHGITYPVFGLIDETGEFLEKFLNEHDVTDADVILELGDVYWYMSAICDTIDIEMQDIFNGAPHQGFYDPFNLFYTVARISGIIKKAIRDTEEIIDKEKLIVELRSFATQLLSFLPNLETTHSEVMERNIIKLKDRASRGVLKGSGDHR